MALSIFFEEDSIFFVGGQGNGSDTDEVGGCTQQWWNDECPNDTSEEHALAMSKIMAIDGEPILTDIAAYNNGNNIITFSTPGMGAAIEVGMVVYVIQDGTPDEDVETGRYKITAVNANWIECDGISGTDTVDVNISIGGAFMTLESAVVAIFAGLHNVRIYSNVNEILTSSVNINSAGDITYNSWLKITGYNTTPKDMCCGGMYYQSADDCLRNGISADSTVTLDADDQGFSMMQLGDDNFVLENFFLTNNDEANNALLFTGTPVNITVKNCRFSYCSFVIGAAADMLIVNGCYTENMVSNHYMFTGNGGLLINCVGDCDAIYAVNATSEGVVIMNCLAVNGTRAVRNFTSNCIIHNCTFYNQTSYGIDVTSGAISLYNSIFALNPTAIGIVGVVDDMDYNCWIETDGSPLTVGEHLYNPVVIGDYGISVDPEFMDPASNDFRLKPTSPCLNTGFAGSDTQCNMGAWQRISRIRR